MSCKNCNFLYHAKCLNLDRNNVEQINEPWYCKNCIKSNLPFSSIDDDGEFHDAIAEMFLCSNSNIYAEIDKIIFNPFEINDLIDTPLTDVDPDFQFYIDSQYIHSNVQLYSASLLPVLMSKPKLKN